MITIISIIIIMIITSIIISRLASAARPQPAATAGRIAGVLGESYLNNIF